MRKQSSFLHVAQRRKQRFEQFSRERPSIDSELSKQYWTGVKNGAGFSATYPTAYHDYRLRTLIAFGCCDFYVFKLSPCSKTFILKSCRDLKCLWNFDDTQMSALYSFRRVSTHSTKCEDRCWKSLPCIPMRMNDQIGSDVTKKIRITCGRYWKCLSRITSSWRKNLQCPLDKSFLSRPAYTDRSSFTTS